MFAILLSAAIAAQAAAARTLTVKNSCSGTIWPAVIGSGAVSGPGGWEQASGTSKSFSVGDGFAGRIWARTGGCIGDVKNCQIGACDGGALECSSSGSLGATLAEFSLSSGAGADYYDVSIVDGFSVPMRITPSDSACTVAACAPDLLASCDPALVWPSGSSHIYACAMPCTAGIQYTALAPGPFSAADSPSCCTGAWLGQAKCTPDLIPWYETYKGLCRDAYVYPDDDGTNSTAVFGCGKGAAYEVEFCPGAVGSGLDSPLEAAGAKQINAGGAINVAGRAQAATATATAPESSAKHTSSTSSSPTSSSDHTAASSTAADTTAATDQAHSHTLISSASAKLNKVTSTGSNDGGDALLAVNVQATAISVYAAQGTGGQKAVCARSRKRARLGDMAR